MVPGDPVAQGMLKVSYVKGSWPDIRKKIQKIDGWMNKPLEELLRETEKVFVRKEDKKQKQQAKVMMTTVNHLVKKRLETGNGGCRQRRDRGGGWADLKKGARKMQNSAGCYHCEKPGHFKRECPDLQKEGRVIPLMNFED